MLSKLARTLSKTPLHTALGSFEIGGILGQGGSGIVFSAKKGHQVFAVKFLLYSSQQKRDRFIDEYLGSMQLPAHRNIARPIHFGEFFIENSTFPYIIMPKYQGTLQRPKGRIELAAVEELARQLLAAMDHMHSNGVIHRDLKPSNIFKANGDYLVGDLGIASFDPSLYARNAETIKGERLANFEFSAPEQVSSTQAKVTMDIYSFGQIIQWYCTGAVHKGTARQPLTSVHPGLHSLDNAIDLCLRNDDAARPQSVAAVRALLSRKDEAEEHILTASRKWDQLHLFEAALRKSCPKAHGSYIAVSQPEISRLMTNLAKIASDARLWWVGADHDDNRISSFQPPEADLTGNWLVNDFELDIETIAIYQDDACYANFIVIISAGDIPFGIHQHDDMIDRAGYWNGHYISTAEYRNGHAEINGEIIELKDPEPQIRIRYLKPRAILIAPQASSAISSAGRDEVTKMLAFVNKNRAISAAELSNFASKFRHHIDEDVALLR